MKNQLKIFLVSLLYNCEIRASIFSESKNQTLWRFKLVPRPIGMTVWFFILSPFLFFANGVSGLKSSWKNKSKIESWSSYEIWSVEKPKKSQCYLLY